MSLIIVFHQPFNNEYTWFNTSDNLIINDPNISELNGYQGGAYQQATSVVTETSAFCLLYAISIWSNKHIHTDQQAYEGTGNAYEIYGFQYQPGFDGGVSCAVLWDPD